MNSISISINKAVAITGAVLIAVYIIFGGTFTTKQKNKKKYLRKDAIPGLANVGNTCFLNCILQALASCPSFFRWLELSIANSQPVLLSTLDSIVKVLNNKTEDSVASAYDVLKALRSHGWVISTEEHDAHELFHALTSTIDDEVMLVRQQSNSLLNVSWMTEEIENNEQKTLLNGSLDESSQSPKEKRLSSSAVADLDASLCLADSPGGSLSKTSVQASGGSLPLLNIKEASIISKVPTSLKHDPPFSKPTHLESPFKGHLASQLHCEVCGFRNVEQWSTFESISLSLPPSSCETQKITLQALLDEYVRPEHVSDVICEGCTKASGEPSHTTFSKQLTIGKLPECLCIHVQRTIWLENGCAVKRKDFVAFPEVLNMDPYTYTVSLSHQETLKGGLLGGRDPKENADLSSKVGKETNLLASLRVGQLQGLSDLRFGWKENYYELQAVVVHVGDVFSGHFVTYRRGALNTNFRKKWFYTSDVVVKEVPLSDVLQSNAYMILYERISL